MRWQNHKHYAESSDGKWRISKAAKRLTGDSRIVLRYRLWFRDAGNWEAMGIFDTGDDAKAKAEELDL